MLVLYGKQTKTDHLIFILPSARKERRPTKDRNVQYPQRYQLVKVEGTDDIYDLIPAPGEVSEAGTLINKATLLKDATAALFRMTNLAVPDDVLAYLGKYNQYWWKRRQYYEVATWIETQTKYVDGSIYNYIILNRNTASNTVQYSDEISIDQSSGAVSLLNPQSISFSNTDSFSNQQNAPLLVGKYISHVYNNVGALLDGIYFIPAGSQAQVAVSDDNTYQTSFVDVAMTVSSEQIQAGNYGPWEYLRSNDRNAYPDSGESGGYEYQFLGIPFDNAVEAPKIATGSYVGTGTYGAGNPNTLTFDFAPKLVLSNMPLSPQANGGWGYGNIIWCPGITGYLVRNGGYNGNIAISVDGNTISWYGYNARNNDGPDIQGNNSGGTYYYIAIG